MVRPTIVVFENKALVTPSNAHAKIEIRRMLKEEGPAELHSFFNASALPEGRVVEFSYADWGKIVARVYGLAKSFVPVIEGSLPSEVSAELPVNLKHLPDANLFTHYFEPSLRTRTRVDDGVVIRCESSIGPEALLFFTGGFLMGAVSAEDFDGGTSQEIKIEVEAPVPPNVPATDD